jgi:hypothetical protein
MICEWHSQGYDGTHSCCVCFGMAGIAIIVMFKVLLLCNLMDIYWWCAVCSIFGFFTVNAKWY